MSDFNPRKIILSRKGFDSSYGRRPSPILEDGRLVPLPIPGKNDSFTFADLDLPIDVDQFLRDTNGVKDPVTSANVIHLDPDLNRPAHLRSKGWRPSLGQADAAQSHLAGQGVCAGDLFLFFGWFRQAEQVRSQWRFVKGAPNLHVLFGWLEIEDVVAVVTEREESLQKYPWLADHPHVANPIAYQSRTNHVYVGRDSTAIRKSGMGGGFFERIRGDRILTEEGRTRTNWILPAWFMPSDDRPPMSYHPDPNRWSLQGDKCRLKSAAKGQEFVLDATHYPEAVQWARSIILD